MSIFFWKNNKQIDTFAFQLADELYSDIPPNLAAQYCAQGTLEKNNKGLKKAANVSNKVTRRLDDTIIKLQQYRALHPLGIYGKARFHMTFTERLKELGYSQDVIKEFSQIIMLRTP